MRRRLALALALASAASRMLEAAHWIDPEAVAIVEEIDSTPAGPEISDEVGIALSAARPWASA